MKILFVSHSGKISGGANRSLLGIAKVLKHEYGVEPCILIPEKNSELEKACIYEGIKVYIANYHTCCTVYRHTVKDIIRFGKLFGAPIIDYLIAQKLKNELPGDFDLVYTNDRMVVVGGYLSRIWKIPHIWHVRSFSKENEIWYSPGYYQLMNKYSDRIVVISNALKNSFNNHIRENKLVLIFNGINVNDYSIPSKVKHEGINILLTGRIVPPKGQLEAIEALHMLKIRHGIEAKLYLAGEIPSYGSNTYYDKIYRKIKEYQLDTQVEFLGEVKDISNIRARMDVEIICSWCEAFGRVTIEAMCSQIPVIGANSGGTTDIIIDGKTGLLYEKGNPEDLAEKIMTICENPEKVEEFIKAGRERVDANFTIQRTVGKIVQLLEQVVNGDCEN